MSNKNSSSSSSSLIEFTGSSGSNGSGDFIDNNDDFITTQSEGEHTKTSDSHNQTSDSFSQITNSDLKSDFSVSKSLSKSFDETELSNSREGKSSSYIAEDFSDKTDKKNDKKDLDNQITEKDNTNAKTPNISKNEEKAKNQKVLKFNFDENKYTKKNGRIHFDPYITRSGQLRNQAIRTKELLNQETLKIHKIEDKNYVKAKKKASKNVSKNIKELANVVKNEKIEKRKFGDNPKSVELIEQAKLQASSREKVVRRQERTLIMRECANIQRKRKTTETKK